MQRLTRSTHAPVGTAFVLVLGLAILPVSLRAAGVQVSFSPRLAAATDAWHQIAEVFGASYPPAPASELCVVRDPDSEPSNAIESPVSPSTASTCPQRSEEWARNVLDVPETRALKAAPVRRACSKAPLRHTLPSNQVALAVAVEAIKASLEKPVLAIGSLGVLKLATLKRAELFKNIDTKLFNQTFEQIGEGRSLPVSKNMRVLVRSKRAAASSSAKTAECKVFAAVAWARRHGFERALLTSSPASPDNSEF